MAPNQSPRNLPRASRKEGSFAPRRSYTRARASKEQIDSLSRIERAQRSQARFARNLKRTIYIICFLAILALLFYLVFLTPEQELDIPEPAKPLATR